jgi:hypothetical protein
VAVSYDILWADAYSIDCRNLKMGPALQKLVTAASHLPVGKSIRCSTNQILNPGATFRYLGNNHVAWYPDPNIAISWDSNYASAEEIDCKNLVRSADAELNETEASGYLNIGDPMICTDNDPLNHPNSAVYRYAGNNEVYQINY